MCSNLQESIALAVKTLQITGMQCRQNEHDEPQVELFKVELTRIIDMNHEMVRLSDAIDWEHFETTFSNLWKEIGRPAISTRLMVSLHYLKYTFDLSDDDVSTGWLQNPYWQYLSGMRYFSHSAPLDPSSMSRWGKKVGQACLEELLAETIRTGLKLKAISQSQLQRVNLDTTVAEKYVRFPTDSRLYNRSRERLVKEADELGIELRQNYNRVGKNLLIQQSRYASAKQYKRARKCQKKLHTILGRVIRDIERKKLEGMDTGQLDMLLEVSKKVHAQQRQDKNKVYSVHAQEVECISKGKAHKRYEFGIKVSIATTSKGGWHLGALILPGKPHDGHTIGQCLEQVERISPRSPNHLFADQGYRCKGKGQSYLEKETQIHIDKKTRGKTPKRLWKWMKRRAAIEPSIGHLKSHHRLERNRLWGEEGDMHNAILSVAGMNFSKLLKHLRQLWHQIFEIILGEIQVVNQFEKLSGIK